jgi:hypothetical protein
MRNPVLTVMRRMTSCLCRQHIRTRLVVEWSSLEYTPLENELRTHIKVHPLNFCSDHESNALVVSKLVIDKMSRKLYMHLKPGITQSIPIQRRMLCCRKQNL